MGSKSRRQTACWCKKLTRRRRRRHSATVPWSPRRKIHRRVLCPFWSNIRNQQALKMSLYRIIHNVVLDCSRSQDWRRSVLRWLKIILASRNQQRRWCLEVLHSHKIKVQIIYILSQSKTISKMISTKTTMIVTLRNVSHWMHLHKTKSDRENY